MTPGSPPPRLVIWSMRHCIYGVCSIPPPPRTPGGEGMWTVSGLTEYFLCFLVMGVKGQMRRM